MEGDVLWRQDGTSFPVERWSYPMRQGGRQVGGVSTFVDITERKRAEEMLRSSHKWTKTDAWASQFMVPVAADGTTMLNYRVRVTY